MAVFFIADMHFGNPRNAKKRRFTSVHEMDTTIADQWRARVHEGDTVWILGDIGGLEPLTELPGEKHLILGNGDQAKGKMVATGIFASVAKSHVFEMSSTPLLLIHDPSHAKLPELPVIHGHTHHGPDDPDPRFVSVSVDKTEWGPILLEEVYDRLRRRLAAATAQQ